MKFKRILSLLLSVIIAVGAVNLAFYADATSAEIEAGNSTVAELDEKIAASQQKLDELAKDTANQKEYLTTLEAQIDDVEAKATNLQNQIDDLNVEIDSLTQQYGVLKKEINVKTQSIKKANVIITYTQNQIDKSSDQLAMKLRQAYMVGEESTLEILMGADSLASFLNRLEMMKRSSESSKKTIEDFETKVTTVKKTKAQLVKDRQVLADNQQKIVETRTQYIEKKNVLVENQTEFKTTVAQIETKYAEVESIIASYDKESEEYKQYVSDLETQKAQAEDAVSKLIAEYQAQQEQAKLEQQQQQQATQQTLPPAANNDSDPEEDYDSDYSEDDSSSGSSSDSPVYSTSDTWAWPVGSREFYISSDYGYRDSVLGTNSNHAAVDISGSGFYGSSIYAARAGTVIFSGDDGYGYGNYVLIDHGDGFTTQYAHNSQNLVNEGDTVEKGQLIAYAGSTGISTGPHLHYAIKYDGEPVDPADYHSEI